MLLRRLLPLLCLPTLLALAAPASAEIKTETFRHGPIEVGGYEVKQQNAERVNSRPSVDGFVTHMEVDVVDADGKPVPISRLMLHHIVFLNAGRTFGEKRDGTCESILALDSKTALPGHRRALLRSGRGARRARRPAGLRLPHQRRRPVAHDVDAHEPPQADRPRLHPVQGHVRHRAGRPARRAVLARRAQLQVRPGLRRARRRQARLDLRDLDDVDRPAERAHRRGRRPRARRRPPPAHLDPGLRRPELFDVEPGVGQADAPLLQRQTDPARTRADSDAATCSRRAATASRRASA